ncbi:MAG: DUF456 domain-containing protein [Bacteroidales bacterium]
MGWDIVIAVIGSVLVLLGIIGCILPVLPGQIISWLALLLLQFSSEPPFTARFLVIWALITAGVTLLDYYVPVWGTKKLGGSKSGVWGATIGLVLGIFFFPPLGLIVGPFAGAVVGELIGGNDSKTAFRAGLGSFVGFLTGTMMKLTISVVMGYYFVINAFQF